MDRKATARETVEIIKKGYYEVEGEKIEIAPDIEKAIKESELISPDNWEELVGKALSQAEEKGEKIPHYSLINASTVKAIEEWYQEGKRKIGVLNFASAKNPGGGFLNGAMAQEESLAASGGLYKTLTIHPQYYEKNRACPSMMYTDYAIYSPNVIFFRDERFELVKKYSIASVLTMPAVNMGQAKRKGENLKLAKQVMKERMRKILSLFADKKEKHLVLGAYGCGVFLNDPTEIAQNWLTLLKEEKLERHFDSICFAVLEKGKRQICIEAFHKVFDSYLS